MPLPSMLPFTINIHSTNPRKCFCKARDKIKLFPERKCQGQNVLFSTSISYKVVLAKGMDFLPEEKQYPTDSL